MPSFAVGVDLGGTNLRIAAVSSDGHLLEKVTTGTQVIRGRDQVIKEMCDAILSLAGKFQGSMKFDGIGIGVPGIIDMATGMLRQSPNLPGWEEYPVRQEIEKRLGVPVILENDANAAAFGEFWLGAGRQVEDMCMLTLGTGVGGGIVTRGRIWHGMTGMAGEMGHITVEPDGHPCGCGNRGCVEQYASATAIVRMARQTISENRASELARAAAENPEFSARMVYQSAIQGDPLAQEIFQVVGRSLGTVVAALINALNLPMYVIGGGVASAWSAFSPAMLEEVNRRSFVYRATRAEHPVPGENTIITRALIGSDAGLFGAARLPMVGQEAHEHEKARALRQ